MLSEIGADASGQVGGGGPITDNATLAFNRSDDISPTNVISGVGGVDVRGTGTVTFNTAQTYSGGLSVTSDSHTSTMPPARPGLTSGAGGPAG